MHSYLPPLVQHAVYKFPQIQCTGRCSLEANVGFAFASVGRRVERRDPEGFQALVGHWVKNGLHVEVCELAATVAALCSHDGTELRFGLKVAAAPASVLEVVAAHEIAHVNQIARAMTFANLADQEIEADCRVDKWGFEPLLYQTWCAGEPLHKCPRFNRDSVAACSGPGGKYHNDTLVRANPYYRASSPPSKPDPDRYRGGPQRQDDVAETPRTPEAVARRTRAVLDELNELLFTNDSLSLAQRGRHDALVAEYDSLAAAFKRLAA